MVLYNVPSRCGTNLEPSTVKRLAAIDNIVGIKEASGNIAQVSAIVVPGAREVKHPGGAKWGLSLYAAVIVKYRDAKTDSRIRLEEFLR